MGRKRILTDEQRLINRRETTKTWKKNNTERPESVKVGASIIAGTNPKNILKCSKKMIKKKRNWENPFGDGRTGEKIVSILLKKF